MAERKQVEIYAEIKRRTAKAVLISDGETEAWLPLSMIEIDTIPDTARDNQARIALPEWLAKDKGLM
jgi:hypothetical protein